jgi:hypothetical protein
MMTRIFGCLSVFTIWGASLLAQSTDGHKESVNHATQTVKSLAGGPSDFASDSTPDASPPPILNILTVIGDNTLGVPCLDCILGIIFPTLGLPSPVSQALQGSNYQIDSYLIDNSYTGSCTFTFTVRDVNKTVVVTTTETLTEKARTEIVLSAPITIPNEVVVGLGSVSNTAVCGTSTTKSSSPVFLACVRNPPYCLN